MNRKVSDCDIVLELLPLYIEKRTGAESNGFVAKHLAECEECREAFELMSADWLTEKGMGGLEESDAETIPAKMDEDASRGGWTNKKIFLLVAGLLAYAGLMVGLVIYTFMYLTGVERRK